MSFICLFLKRQKRQMSKSLRGESFNHGKTFYVTILYGRNSIEMLFLHSHEMKDNRDTRDFQNATFSKMPVFEKLK